VNFIIKRVHLKGYPLKTEQFSLIVHF